MYIQGVGIKQKRDKGGPQRIELRNMRRLVLMRTEILVYQVRPTHQDFSPSARELIKSIKKRKKSPSFSNPAAFRQENPVDQTMIFLATGHDINERATTWPN